MHAIIRTTRPVPQLCAARLSCSSCNNPACSHLQRPAFPPPNPQHLFLNLKTSTHDPLHRAAGLCATRPSCSSCASGPCSWRRSGWRSSTPPAWPTGPSTMQSAYSSVDRRVDRRVVTHVAWIVSFLERILLTIALWLSFFRSAGLAYRPIDDAQCVSTCCVFRIVGLLFLFFNWCATRSLHGHGEKRAAGVQPSEKDGP